MMESPIEFRKAWALTMRDMAKWATYKSTAWTTLLGGGIAVASWGLNATFRNVTVPQYNTDYVSFLVVGILVANFILPVGAGVSSRLNPYTLESILMTGPKLATLVVGTSLWPYMLSALFAIPQVLIGVYVFGAHLRVDPLSFAIASIIGILIVLALAIIATGIKIVTKQADPITWGVALAASILSGMTFPIQHLNDYIPGLSSVSWLLPQTWIFHIIRLATLTDASIFDPSTALAFLAASIYALVLLPLSYFVFSISLRRAKKEGSLGWF